MDKDQTVNLENLKAGDVIDGVEINEEALDELSNGRGE